MMEEVPNLIMWAQIKVKSMIWNLNNWGKYNRNQEMRIISLQK